jgi:enolase
VEVQLSPAPGAARAVPSGAWIGKREVSSARRRRQRYRGRAYAVRNVEETIVPAWRGCKFRCGGLDQAPPSSTARRTSALGANAILAGPLAVARAAADDAGLCLRLPGGLARGSCRCRC